VVPPFQGWIVSSMMTQGVALGWLVKGPLTLECLPVTKVHDTL
jgi:hypothetical protein